MVELKKIFVFGNIILVIALFSLVVFIYSGKTSITLKAVYDLKEESKDFEVKSIVTELDYEKGLEEKIGFSVLNGEHKRMKVLLTVEGELNSSITLYDSLVEFMPSEDSKSFFYDVKLDGDLEPGLHEAEIVALYVPEAGSEGGYTGSSYETVSNLKVHVPYPGKYADGELGVLNAEKNKTADFNIDIINRGRLDIEKVSADIEIYSLLDEKIAVIESDSVSLKAGEESKLSAKWLVDAAAGDYIAKVKLIYDEESRDFEKKFSVGSKLLSIEGILVSNFNLGEIAKLQILVENKWNLNLNNVFASLVIYNKDGLVMADIKSSPYTIEALTKKELAVYWDTVKVEEERYNAKLSINYDGESVEKDLILDVGQTSLEVFGVGYLVKPKAKNNPTLTTILFILVILLLIGNLSWFVFFRRLSGKSKEPRGSRGKI